MKRTANSFRRFSTQFNRSSRIYKCLFLPQTPFYIGMILLIAAVSSAYLKLRHIQYPWNVDQYRDLAAIQSVLDGNFISDPYYLGETIWYNPLLSWVIALISKFTDLPAAAAYVGAGPILNLLAPIACFLILSLWFNPWTALICFTMLLFSSDSDLLHTPVYDPWLYPFKFAFVFSWVGLFWGVRLFTSPNLKNSFLFGVTLGISFLTHTAPFLVLGLSALVGFVLPVFKKKKYNQKRAARNGFFIISLIFCACVGGPLLLSILLKYKLKIVHSAPNDWFSFKYSLSNLPSLIWSLVRFANIFAVVGFFVLLRSKEKVIECRAILLVLCVVTVLLGYGYLKQMFRQLPSLVPSFHFYAYLLLYIHILKAIGIFEVIKVLARIVTKDSILSKEKFLIVLLIMFSFLKNYPIHYKQISGVAEARSKQTWYEESSILPVLRKLVPPNAVILGSEHDSIFNIAPAGRHIVAGAYHFSNPFVSFDRRNRDRHEMLSAALKGEDIPFYLLAKKYGVSFVLLTPIEKPKVKLDEVYKNAYFILYRIPNDYSFRGEA